MHRITTVDGSMDTNIVFLFYHLFYKNVRKITITFSTIITVIISFKVNYHIAFF